MGLNYLKFLLLLAFISGFVIFSLPAQAAGGLSLKTIKECSIENSGDNCTSTLEVANTTGYILTGKVFLNIHYKGVCEGISYDGFFDGNGLEALFLTDKDSSWMKFSTSTQDWIKGTVFLSGFNIAKGTSYPRLVIKTSPELCPGEYVFKLGIEGMTETKEVYRGGAIIVGGEPMNGIVKGISTVNPGPAAGPVNNIVRTKSNLPVKNKGINKKGAEANNGKRKYTQKVSQIASESNKNVIKKPNNGEKVKNNSSQNPKGRNFPLSLASIMSVLRLNRKSITFILILLGLLAVGLVATKKKWKK